MDSHTFPEDDLWRAIGELLAARPHRQVLVVTVESHVAAGDMAQGYTSERMDLGNEIADAVAGWAAKKIAPEEADAVLWRWVTAYWRPRL